MRTGKFIFAIVMLTGLFGCQRLATVEVPTTASQAVLFAFLSPEDTLIKVTLTKSQPIFGNGSSGSFDPVDDALVSINDNNGNTKVIPFNTTVGAYCLGQSQFPIQPGFTYTIEASKTGFHVKGKTTIPVSQSSFEEVKLEKFSAGNFQIHYVFSMKWKDEWQVHNFYRLSIEENYVEFGKDTIGFPVGDGMFKDDNRDGETFNYKLDLNYYSGSAGPFFTAYILNTDQAYYEYHRRRLIYYGDDPFSEPSPQYSNVDGGLGVICSYRKTGKPLKL